MPGILISYPRFKKRWCEAMKSKIVWAKPSEALIKMLLIVAFSIVFGGFYYAETYLLSALLNF